MKYVPPYGRESEGDAAHYINGNPVEGREGSIPPADAFEHPMREIVAVIDKSKLTPDAADLMQMAKAVRSQRMNFADDTGAANLLSVSYDPPLTAYTVGLLLRVRVHTTNTGGVTIDAGAGRVPVKKMNGGGTAAGDLPAGGICDLVYDGSGFQLVNFGGSGGTGTGDQFLIKIPYCVDSSVTPNIVTAVFSPAITTLTAGDPLLVKINNTCTGSSVIKVNALADKPIKANGGDVLLQGDLQKNDVVLFLYDGTSFWIQPNPLISADTTINVPSQYATAPDALLAIRRKTIAQNARVTILMATAGGPATGYGGQTGCYLPFTVNHANADRITIRGALKIPGNVTGGMLSMSGNRPNDSVNNLGILRSHFGVEITVPPNASYTAGIENVGPGNPTIQDILITGPNFWSGEGIGRWVGVGLNGGRYINTVNVSTWGLDIGFYGGGTLAASYSHMCGCFRNGALATGLANFGFNACAAISNFLGGLTCNQNAFIATYNCFSNYNGNHGALATDNSELTYHTSQAIGNANFDCGAGPLSMMMILNSAAAGGVGTVTPAPGVISSVGALVSWTP